MTNGELIQKVFNCEVCEPIPEDDIIHVIFSDKKDSVIGFDWSWWNMEYKDLTTKNDLAVDCINRTELLKAMDTWDKFGYDPNERLIPLRTPALKDRYVPYVKYDDMVNCVKGMPQVSPRPRKGHWKLVQRGKFIDICCSNCEAVRVKEYAYNYTIEQLDKEDVKKCFESDDMRYCPYCGSDNREVEE